jgi:hypothetical protein
MAEGLLGGALGDEKHKPEVEAPEALASAEAFAAAVAARLSGNDPGVARKTEEFLSEQTRLLKVQREHLKDEHAARLHYLRGQAREVDIRRFGMRLRIGFQLFLALVPTAVAIGGAVMIRDAVTSRRVVIDPFDIAPNVSPQVPGGKIVAGGLLDELSRLQDATRSKVQRLDLSNAWTSQVKLEVAETGVSLGELSRLLRGRFGHDVHIEGDLIETPAGASR